MNIVITIDDDESVDVCTEIRIKEILKPKQRKKLIKDKNIDRILTKVKGETSKKRQRTALDEGVRLVGYADRISKKLTRKYNYIKKELVRNPDFVKPLKIRAILSQVNKTLHKDNKPVAKTTLL